MTTTTVTMQLNAVDIAGDWATRPAGTSRSGTSAFAGPGCAGVTGRSGQLAVHLSELRGAIEAIRRGHFSPNVAETRTQFVGLAYGSPIAYCGMRFALGA